MSDRRGGEGDAGSRDGGGRGEGGSDGRAVRGERA